MKKLKIFKPLILFISLFTFLLVAGSKTNSNILSLDNVSNMSNDTKSEENITINNKYLDVTLGSTLKLDYTIKGNLTIDNFYVYNPSVLTVSKDGVITGRSKGTSLVRITLSDESCKDIYVNVTDNPTSVSLTSNLSILGVGDTARVRATLSPLASNRNVTYSSSDTSKATVDDDGVVTAVSKGVVKITVKTINGLTADYTFTVLEKDTTAFTTYTYEVDKYYSNKILAFTSRDDINNKHITLTAQSTATNFEEAPTYIVEFDNISIESTEAKVPVSIYTEGYVNFIFRIKGDLTLIGSSYPGINCESVNKSTNVNVKFELLDTTSTITIGLTENLNEEDFTSDGNVTYTLGNYVKSANNYDISSLTTDIENLKNAGDKVSVTLNNYFNDEININFDYKTSTALLSSTTSPIINYSKTFVDIPNNYEDTVNGVNCITDNLSICTGKAEDINKKVVISLYGSGTCSVVLQDKSNNFVYDYFYLSVFGNENTDSILISNLEDELYGQNTIFRGLESSVSVTCDSSYTLVSSDESIFTVSGNKVKGVSEGTAYLYAYISNYPTNSTFIELTVIVKDEGVTVDDSLITNISVNDKVNLTNCLSVSPSDAKYKDLKVEVEDNGVLSLDESTMTLTALKNGSAKVTVTTYGGSTKDITFTVSDHVSEIKSDLEESTIIENGTTFDLSTHLTVLPANALNKSLKFESSDTDKATVDENGLITTLTKGLFSITVTSLDNETVTKELKFESYIKVTEIEIANLDSYIIYDRWTLDLAQCIKVLPEEASCKSVTYSSSDEKILTVTSEGKVTGVTSGKATITITSVDGVTKEIEFESYIYVENVIVENLDSYVIKDKASFNLAEKVSVLPADASNKTLTYTSSDESILTVTSDGVVTGITSGKAKIIITSVDKKSTEVEFESYISVTDITTNLDSFVIKDKEGINLNEKFKVSPLDSTNKTLSFSSSDTSIFKISDDGVLTGVTSGKATITVTARDGVLKTFEFESYISATSIDVSLEKYTYELCDTIELAKYLTVMPSDSTNKTLTYTIDNTEIASVSETGLITTLKTGSFKVTITQADINKELEFKVIVSVTGIEKTNQDTLNTVIEKGNTLNISSYFNVLPSNSTNQNVTYSVSDETIASVTEAGVITGLNKGTFTLTVTTVDGDFKTSFDLEVYVTVTDVYVEVPENTTFKVNDTYQIKAHVLPEDANVQTLSYYIPTTKASVNQSGLVTFKQTGSDNGEVKITIRSREGNIEKTLILYVVEPVTSISITGEESKVLPIGETYKITYEILPSNASNKNVKFTSSNSSIASVSENGTVTSKSTGTATITVTTVDGSKTASITIYAGPHVESISINNTDSDLHVGDKVQIKVTISPSDASLQKFTYSTSNSEIASITEDGVVTALKTGQLRITVTTLDEGKSASVTFNIKNVQDKPEELKVTSVEVYNDSIVILNPLSTVEYRLVDSNNNVISDWNNTIINNKITFSNLSDNTTYVIEYRTPGTPYKDASDSLTLSVKTLKNEYVKLPTVAIVFIIIGGVAVLGAGAFFIIKGIKKKKKNI